MEKDKIIELISKLEDEKVDNENDVYGLLHSLDTDVEYLDNYEKIKDKEIEFLSIEELATTFTFILRGERFCRGHIMTFVEDGRMLKLAKRYLQLVNHPQTK